MASLLFCCFVFLYFPVLGSGAYGKKIQSLFTMQAPDLTLLHYSFYLFILLFIFCAGNNINTNSKQLFTPINKRANIFEIKLPLSKIQTKCLAEKYQFKV